MNSKPVRKELNKFIEGLNVKKRDPRVPRSDQYAMEITISSNERKGMVRGRIDKKPAGAITFSVANEDLIIIDHTEVDEAFKGQSVGKELLLFLVEHLRENNIKAIPLCPYANAMFKKMPEIRDVLK